MKLRDRNSRVTGPKIRVPIGSFCLLSSTAAAVLLSKQNEPIGTRIFGPVTRELRSRNFMKIVSLAPEVL